MERAPIWCRERPAKQRDVRIDGAGHLPEESQRYDPSQVYRRLSAPACLFANAKCVRDFS
jgi:hypothetical protein